MDIKEIVGVRMREARYNGDKKKVTLKDLSARVEILGLFISENMLGKMENGCRPINLQQLDVIARALHVSISWLVGETDDPARH